MKLMNLALLVGALSLSFGVIAHEKEHPAPASNPGFDKIKSLAGDWEMVGGDGSVAASYRITGGGTTVIETLFPGSPHEMVTVYNPTGKEVALTHYCAVGNQPSMKTNGISDANTLAFKFSGGMNLDAKKDGHMHEMTMKFVDADTVKAEWVYYEGGKKGESKSFDMKRKKS